MMDVQTMILRRLALHLSPRLGSISCSMDAACTYIANFFSLLSVFSSELHIFGTHQLKQTLRNSSRFGSICIATPRHVTS